MHRIQCIGRILTLFKILTDDTPHGLVRSKSQNLFSQPSNIFVLLIRRIYAWFIEHILGFGDNEKRIRRESGIENVDYPQKDFLNHNHTSTYLGEVHETIEFLSILQLLVWQAFTKRFVMYY